VVLNEVELHLTRPGSIRILDTVAQARQDGAMTAAARRDMLTVTVPDESAPRSTRLEDAEGDATSLRQRARIAVYVLVEASMQGRGERPGLVAAAAGAVRAWAEAARRDPTEAMQELVEECTARYQDTGSAPR
jgi:hypothetical protein